MLITQVMQSMAFYYGNPSTHVGRVSISLTEECLEAGRPRIVLHCSHQVAARPGGLAGEYRLGMGWRHSLVPSPPPGSEVAF